MKNRNPNKKIKSWCCAIALDVLLKHNINPLDIISVSTVAKYWLSVRRNLTVKAAIKQFSAYFSASKSVVKDVSKLFESYLNKDN